jgi:hypothetical protein
MVGEASHLGGTTPMIRGETDWGVIIETFNQQYVITKL